MGSRIREDVTQLYLSFCEVARPENSEKEAWIIQKYPDSYKDEQVLGSVPKFAYPCEFENTTVQHFSFVLTNLDSKWTFGFCRHDPKTETALVFLSHLPWHEVFIKILNCVAELIRCSKPEELNKFLYKLLRSKVPDPGASLTVSYNNDQSKLVCQCPLQFQLPKIPENRNLTEYYSAVEINNMLVIFASMLYERRIIFISRRPSRLSACVQAANAIIYPMHWQHIYIPVLPKHLIDYLLAPMPFLIGVPTPIWEGVKKADLGDVVVLDADSNLLSTPFNDVESLPQDIVKFLKSQLKNRSALLDDGFARVFLRALVQLIGGYRDALKFHQGQRITFSEEAFIESRPSNMQPFLRDMLHLQIFQQFIEERLDLLNAGLGFSDEFEFEACNYSEKSSSKIKAQYKEWVSTMRVQGSAFLKTVKNKANPAMKSAVKSVKEKGKDVKTAYKGIRSKMKRETNFRETSSMKPDRSQPRSAPSSPTSHRTRPMTFGNIEPISAATTYKKQRRSAAPASRSNEYVPLSPPSDDLTSPVADAELASKSDVLPRLDMDLMGDLQEVINRQCSLVDKSENPSSPPVFRSLKPVRSFDTFQQFGKGTARIGSPLSANSSSPVHTPLSFTSSLPISSFSTSNNNPFSFSFPSTNPLISDPFGFTSNTATTNTKLLPLKTDMNSFFPDVVQTSFKSNGLVSSNNNNITLPAIATHAPAPAQKGKLNGSGSVGDLIRLDSIPKEESFDPLENDDNDECIAFPQGLTNPLYPYYKINGTKESDKSNTDKTINSRFSSNTSFLHSSTSLTNSQFNKQDLDLLKEYGIDFKTNGNNITNGNKTNDPFEIAFDNSMPQKNSQSNWATFD